MNVKAQRTHLRLCQIECGQEGYILAVCRRWFLPICENTLPRITEPLIESVPVLGDNGCDSRWTGTSQSAKSEQAGSILSVQLTAIQLERHNQICRWRISSVPRHRQKPRWTLQSYQTCIRISECPGRLFRMISIRGVDEITQVYR